MLGKQPNFFNALRVGQMNFLSEHHANNLGVGVLFNFLLGQPNFCLLARRKVRSKKLGKASIPSSGQPPKHGVLIGRELKIFWLPLEATYWRHQRTHHDKCLGMNQAYPVSPSPSPSSLQRLRLPGPDSTPCRYLQ
jgi:hypothetical protein